MCVRACEKDGGEGGGGSNVCRGVSVHKKDEGLERKTNVCGVKGACYKDEGGDKEGIGHKMLEMERVYVRRRRRGRGRQTLWWKACMQKG